MKLLLIHGLGQSGIEWKFVRNQLDRFGIQTSVPALYDLVGKKTMTFENLLQSFEHYCALQNDELILCGISLGGILAIEYAKRNPDKVAGLILISMPYKIPKVAFSLQNIVFRMAPVKFFQSMKMGKEQCLSLLDSMKELKISENLETLFMNTLLIYGEKDKINQKGMIEMQARIPYAQLKIIPKAGHEVNKDQPNYLANKILAFIREFD